MITVKEKKVSKLLLIFVLAVSFILGQCVQAQAAAKKADYSITLNRSAHTLRKGKTVKLKAALNRAAKQKGVVWKSSNPKVASVSKSGTVTAKRSGKATITARIKGTKRKASCRITVKPASERPAAPETPEQPEIPEQTVAPEQPEAEKLLVAYFSWSGTSERIARNIIEQTGADAFRIERAAPYSDNYNEVAYGEAKDEADTNARPPIKDPLASVEQYDKIVLCYPIWWHTAPMTVGTFLESYDFSGKYIYPVSQSASMDAAQYAQSVAFIKECAKGAVVDDGIFSKDNDAIRSYIASTVLPVE